MTFEKYRKKKNCAYPFTNEPLGYCWGYANAVDEGRNIDCSGCEFQIKGKYEVPKMKKSKKTQNDTDLIWSELDKLTKVVDRISAEVINLKNKEDR